MIDLRLQRQVKEEDVCQDKIWYVRLEYGLNRMDHAETLAFSVSLPLNSSTLTCCTREQNPVAPSSSLLLRLILTLTLLGRLRTPCDQRNWLSLGSMRTSEVLMSLVTSCLISLTARGAFLLNWTRWASLWTLMVVSMAVSVSPVLCSFFTIDYIQ